MSKLPRILDLLLPRFIREDLAVNRVGYSSMYEIVHRLEDVRPGECFDGIATFSSFAAFGFSFFVRQVSEIRPFVNPHDGGAQ